MKKFFLTLFFFLFSHSVLAEQYKIVCDEFKHYESIYALDETSFYSDLAKYQDREFIIDLKNNIIHGQDTIFEQPPESDADAVISEALEYKIILNKDGFLLATHLFENKELGWYYVDLINLSMMTGKFLFDDENFLIEGFEKGFVGKHFWSRNCEDEGGKLANRLNIKSLNFTINDQIINPNIIECLYTYESCLNTGPNYKTKGMQYQVHFPMKRLRYTNPINPEERGYNIKGYNIGEDYSYWLIDTKLGEDDVKTAAMIVEVYDPKNNPQLAHVRAVKIIPFDRSDVKYGYSFSFDDKDKDGIEDLIFSYKTGGTGVQNTFEDIHFLDWETTENQKVEVKTINTHYVGFLPNLDEEIKQEILDKNPAIQFIKTTTREPVFTRDTRDFWLVEKNVTEFKMDKYNYKTNVLFWKIVENYAKNNKANYKRKKNNATVLVVEH